MAELGWTRALFGTALGFHIIFATLGVGLPLLIALAEILALRRRDPLYRLMARRWAAVFSVFLGVGVVSGTIVALLLQLLWPGFMRLVGQIIAVPFAIEVFAFFIEAVFTAIYIYAGDRISPGWRILSALLVAVGAGGSALLITDVNAFMNTPAGFRLDAGRIVDLHPWRAMVSPAMPTELSHVLVTAYLAVALVVAAFSAWGLLTDRQPQQVAYRRRALDLTMAVAAVAAVLTGVTGDWAGKFLAAAQPVKFAALEGVFRTGTAVPLTIGGLPDANTLRTRWGIDIPGLLSWLATGRLQGRVQGLLDFPRTDWPPLWVHPLFDLMVAVGTLAFLAAASFWVIRLRRPGTVPPTWLLRALVVMGPVGMMGVEAGWVGAEVARQPWTVTGILTTAQAVTPTPKAGLLFLPFVALYAVLALGAASAVRDHFRRHPLAGAVPAETPRVGPVPKVIRSPFADVESHRKRSRLK